MRAGTALVPSALCGKYCSDRLRLQPRGQSAAKAGFELGSKSPGDSSRQPLGAGKDTVQTTQGMCGKTEAQRWAGIRLRPRGPWQAGAELRASCLLAPGYHSFPPPGVPPTQLVSRPGGEAEEEGRPAQHPSPGAGWDLEQKGFSQKYGLRADLDVPSPPLPQPHWQLRSTISQQVAVLWSYC